MFNFCRLGVKALLTVALLAGVMGCGSTASNDQGSSFLALGYFTEADREQGDLGRVVLLNRDYDMTGSGVQFEVAPYMGLENRLSKQYIRVVRIDCEYDIPGADPSLEIPSGTFNTAFVINGTDSVEESSSDDTVEVINPVYASFSLLSPDFFQFLSINQNLLPTLPYEMTAICSATGVTEAGDVLTTNDAPYYIIMAELQEGSANSSTEASAFNTGAGTGGTPLVAGGDASSTATSVVANSESEMAELEDAYL